jgi:uncharacterized membrane protein HdeD (DUF308 family)
MNPSSPLYEVESSMERHAGGAMALRGLIAVVLGAIAIRKPDVALGAFVLIVAIYAFADGVIDFVLAARFGRAGLRWGWFLLEGIASVALGCLALAFPGLTIVTLVVLIALRAIALGVFQVVTAFMSRWDWRWLLGLTGILSAVLGIMLLANPATGSVALVWAIGLYAIVSGVALFALGLRMLSASRHETPTTHAHTSP